MATFFGVVVILFSLKIYGGKGLFRVSTAQNSTALNRSSITLKRRMDTTNTTDMYCLLDARNDTSLDVKHVQAR